MNLVLLSVAERELRDIIAFYEQQGGGLRGLFLNEFIFAIGMIRLYPEGFRLITRKTRKCILRKFPYMILYGIIDNVIVVSAIAHQNRDPRNYLS